MQIRLWMVPDESLPLLKISDISTHESIRLLEEEESEGKHRLVVPETSWELITNTVTRTGVTKCTEVNFVCSNAGSEEIEGFPHRG